MNNQEKVICELADAIRAGLVTVFGEMEVREVGYTTLEIIDLNVKAPPRLPDLYEFECRLDCQRRRT